MPSFRALKLGSLANLEASNIIIAIIIHNGHTRNKTKQKNFVEPIQVDLPAVFKLFFDASSFDCRYIEFTFDIKYFCAYQFHSRHILVY